MTKAQLAKELAVSEKLHLSTAVKAIDGIIRIASEKLISGEILSLHGFGTLAPVFRDERKARNPQTGEEIILAAHRSVKFKINKELKAKMN